MLNFFGEFFVFCRIVFVFLDIFSFVNAFGMNAFRKALVGVGVCCSGFMLGLLFEDVVEDVDVVFLFV